MSETTSSERDWLSMVVEADPDHYEQDTAYKFSNGRELKSTDNTDDSMIYGS